MQRITFEAAFPQMRSGDVILYKQTDTFLGWLIFLFSKFTHAGILIRRSPSRIKILEMIAKVGKSDVQESFIEKRFPKRGFYWLKTSTDSADRDKFVLTADAIKKKDPGYDFGAFLKFPLCKEKLDDKEYICSELVYAMWKKVKPQSIKPITEVPSPEDLLGLIPGELYYVVP